MNQHNEENKMEVGFYVFKISDQRKNDEAKKDNDRYSSNSLFYFISCFGKFISKRNTYDQGN